MTKLMEYPTGYKKNQNNLHHEDSQTMGQVRQRGCTISPFGGFQGPTAQSPRQSVWSHSWTCSEQEGGLGSSWGPFQLELCYNLMQKNSDSPSDIIKAGIFHFSTDFI